MTQPPEVSTWPPPPPDLSIPTRARFGRRRFLVGAGAVGLAGLASAAAVERWSAFGGSAAGASTGLGASGGVLVLVALYGGNDGLNTVVPYTDSAYHAGRPNLGYQPNQVIPLADGLGLNPQLKGMKALWDAKSLAVVRGVGYPNPSLSHFQSMDIWQTANLDANGSGWLGRWLDATGSDPLRAIGIGSTLPPALRGEKTAATAITAATITLPGQASLQTAYSSLAAPGPDRVGLASAVAGSGANLLSAQRYLAHLSSATPADAAKGAGTGEAAGKGKTHSQLGDQLGTVASLITAGAPTRVYLVSLASFDTHADEKANQERLLGELDQAVSSFLASMKGTPRGKDVVLMTFSEFGRRVAENASGGTDHGTASPLFVAGEAVKGGRFYGEQPSLTDLDTNGDLKYNVDFRSVYATMLDRVVGVDPKSFLDASFPILALI